MNPSVFRSTNCGKKSVSIDLKHPRGREILLSLARGADVLIEGNRPGVMARLGLAYEDLLAINRRLIYCSLTGYGQQGPYSQLAGHDVNYMALGGVLSLNLPVIPGVQIADLVGGSMQAVTGILLALFARNKTGQGRHVDVSMYAGVTSLLTIPLAAWRETGREPMPGGEILSGRYACYNLYQAADGRWLAVGALEPKFWAELCRRLGCEDLIARQFEEHAGWRKVARRVNFPRQNRRQLVCGFARQRLLCDAGPHCRRSRGPICPIRRSTAPALGEHTREVLGRIQCSSTEIDELARQGVIR